MAILSERIKQQVTRRYRAEYGLGARFMDLSGRTGDGTDPLGVLSNTRRRRDYALQESVNLGEPYVFMAAPGISTWLVGIEDRRIIYGGIVGGEVRVEEPAATATESLKYLSAHGMRGEQACDFVRQLPVWTQARARSAAVFLQQVFYEVSGWHPELMGENRLKVMQRRQLAQAIEDFRERGEKALYAFEKERMLLANIRAGDRGGAKQILNEMLAVIYMSSPELVVLRARAIELMTCLTRAAIEDNPLMEPLIERNHIWTDRLIGADSFEGISGALMEALDDFIDGIYLHGVNRSNRKVRMALDYISRNFEEKMSLVSVADRVGLSPCRLAHLVKEHTGRTVLQIIQQMRIRHAQHLLERTDRSCAEVAYECGFGDQSYFTRHFRRLTGTTPARYRRARTRWP